MGKKDLDVITIKIKRTLTPDGQDQHRVWWTPEDAAIVDLLGLLRLAEDTVIRDKMGEEPM